VNLFVPSTAKFTTGNVQIAQETSFPDGDSAKLTLTMPSPKKFTLAVRRPYWAGDGFVVKVNGEKIEQPSLASLRDPAAGGRGNAPGNEAATASSSFVDLTRTWKSGDVVELTLPKSVRLEPTPDNRSVASIMWGPLVLAGDLAPRREGRATREPEPAVPVLVAGDRPVSEWVVPTGARAGDFRAQKVARIPAQEGAPGDVSLSPCYRTHRRTYSVYFDVLTPAEFDSRGATLVAERARLAKIEANTVGVVQPGDTQAETTANYQSEPRDRTAQRTNGRGGRGGPGWFSYDLPVDGGHPMAVVVTYFSELGLPPATGDFDILVDGTSIAHYQPDVNGREFYFTQYAIPSNLTSGKNKVTVRFQAASNGRVAPVFGVRTIRTD
jgi:hypothetical protein